MAQFAVPLLLPDLAWDLLADLEPILLTATEPRSHVVEVFDQVGAFESENVESARTESARREHRPQRVTVTIKGYAGPAGAPQRRREYTVSLWVSGLTWGGAASVNGHATGGGAHAASYAERLLGELGDQVRAFLRHHYIPAEFVEQYLKTPARGQRNLADSAAQSASANPDRPQPPAQAQGEAAPGRPARGFGRLLHVITHQPLTSTIVGSTIAGVLAAIIIAWLIGR